jgi:hypothetical protein
MADIDDFATTLLEESKRFLEKAKEASDTLVREPNLHAALMLAFSSLEAHVNAIADEFSTIGDLTIHEKAVLLEQEVRLEDGEFKLLSTLRIIRLEDRIQFLHNRFSGKKLDRSQPWWSSLNHAIKLRNRLTHPKDAAQIQESDVRNALQSIVDGLDALYRAIYRRSFPAAGRGMNSKLNF